MIVMFTLLASSTDPLTSTDSTYQLVPDGVHRGIPGDRPVDDGSRCWNARRDRSLAGYRDLEWRSQSWHLELASRVGCGEVDRRHIAAAKRQRVQRDVWLYRRRQLRPK